MKYILQIPGISEKLKLKVHSAGDSGVSADIRTGQIWEPYETELVVNNLSAGDVFLDIGANIGYYSVIASSIVGGSGQVIAYEPESDNYRLLVENLQLNQLSNVQSFQAALADYSGSGYLYMNSENRGDHQIYNSGGDRNRVKTTILCAADHLTDLVSKVDFIKVDTQGSESMIIKSLNDLIVQNSDRVKLIVELWPSGLIRAGSSGGELLDVLFSFNLSCNIIDHLNFQLFPAVRNDFDDWLVDTENDEKNEGFFNLLFCPRSYSVRDAKTGKIQFE